MKIAIFGYYNFFNAGDDRIQHCLKRIFSGHILVFFPHFLPPPNLKYLNTFDWIIIGGGGLVRERVGIWVNMSRWLKGLRANVGVIGLGVNSITPELSRELSTLLDYAQFFFVRDSKSKQLLNNDSRVEVYPDLTWCFPLAKTTDTFNNTIAINLTPCHEQKFEPDKWLERCSHQNLIPFPLYFTKNRDYWLLQKYFGDRPDAIASHPVPEEFDLQPLRTSKMLIACRFHAIVFAMQLGKPFIAINYDDKVKRLLTESNLAHLCLEPNEYHLLPEKINFVESHRHEIERTINIYATQQTYQAKIILDKLNQNIANTPLVEHPRAAFKRKIKELLKIN
ncbi:polysaccharide pyruvyl transferase family protein [Pleurocapsa sp. PCC 7319]|uniref:polysaccharide pyruvyl transferase family protein n=1 Tax=Pleurocapsa sp. PCC 7319 TaxID=118161 RepID=UPI0003494C10|nr:polysaccharide pyruvyl transferase family protein [Pleurocapsa sp. PCC 7319]